MGLSEIVLLLSFYLTPVYLHLNLPSYIKPCKQNDPELNQCVVKNGRQAIPKFIGGDERYDVPKLDPMEIKELRIHQAGNRHLGISLSLKDNLITGLKQAQFKAARVDLKKRHIEWDFYHPFITIVGKYDISGQVLILPIRGKGGANITLLNTRTYFKFDFDLVKGEDGEEYMKVTNSNLGADIGKAHFKFNNLFNGDRLLGDTMNNFLNQNWKDVVKELGAPVIDSITQIFKILLSRITELVPYRLVYPPK